MLTKEKLQHHINHLQEKHDELDKRIRDEHQPEYIQTVLKKEKLHLKDEIVTLREKMNKL